MPHAHAHTHAHAQFAYKKNLHFNNFYIYFIAASLVNSPTELYERFAKHFKGYLLNCLLNALDLADEANLQSANLQSR